MAERTSKQQGRTRLRAATYWADMAVPLMRLLARIKPAGSASVHRLDPAGYHGKGEDKVGKDVWALFRKAGEEMECI